MIENITKTKYYHTGYPIRWGHRRNHLYALYSQQYDCFVYVNHDQDLVRKIQCLISSKIPLWVYDLWLPADQAVAHTITNENAEEWTLCPEVPQLPRGRFLSHHDRIQPVDCTNVNVLGQLAGIALKDNSNPNELLIELREYILFCGWIVDNIKKLESPHEEIMFRVAMANALHKRTDLLDTDVYFLYSKVYEALLLASSIEEAKLTLRPILDQIKTCVRLSKVDVMLDKPIDLDLV